MNWGSIPDAVTALAALLVAAISAWNALAIRKVQHQTNAMHDRIVAREKEESDAAGYKRGVNAAKG